MLQDASARGAGARQRRSAGATPDDAPTRPGHPEPAKTTVAAAPRWPTATELEAGVQRRYLALILTIAVLIPTVFAVGHLLHDMPHDAIVNGSMALAALACRLWFRRTGRADWAVHLFIATAVGMLAWRMVLQGAPLAGQAWWLSITPLLLAGVGLFPAAVCAALVFVAAVTWMYFGGPSGLAGVPTIAGVGPMRQYVAVVGSEGVALALILAAVKGRREVSAAIEATRVAAMEADAVKSRFLANMSHEIRTPLNGVIGTAELLRDRQIDDAQRAQLTGLLDQSARTLLSLVDNVLDWSKLEAGKVVLEARPFNVRQLVFDANELFAIRAYDKGIELTSSCNPDVPRQLVGDATRLRQIVHNLVGNAVKFTGRGGVHIHLSVEPGGAAGSEAAAWVRIEVSDSGIGIDPQKLGTLFRAFTQADESVTRRYGGTGLGLAICNELARLMGGRIEVASAPGRGSTFALLVPLGMSEPEELPRGDRPRDDVAIVSASPGVQRHLKTILHDLSIDPEVMGQLPMDGLPGDARIVLIDAPLLDALPDRLGWLEQQRSEGRRVVVIAPLGSQAAAVLPDDVLLLYKPVRRRALKAVLEALEHPPGSREVAREFPPTLPSVGPHVLVAEDDAVNQITVQAMLNELGATCVVASSGREALTCLAAERFDLVLMDMQMPEIDGITATRAWRATEAGSAARRLPVIAMTANAPGENLAACREAGMDDFLAKPFRIAALRDVLVRWTTARA